MKNQVCTEVQMNELINLGVNIDGASCFRDKSLIERVFTIPDMLDRMPCKINGYDLIIYKSTDGWFAGYINYESSKLLYNLGAKCSILRDAVYLIFKELAIMGKLIEK